MSYVVPRSYIDDFSNGIEEISAAYKRVLRKALLSTDLSDPLAENIVAGVMRHVCKGSTANAAYLTKKFYMGLRSRMVGDDDYSGVEDAAYNPAFADAAAHDAMSKPASDKESYVADALCGRLGYATKRAAHETTYANVRADPRKPRLARVPRRTRSYAAGCPFCQTLASRGFVYLSRETASVHVHDGCSCVVVPSWDPSPAVEGYDPSDYNDGYAKFRAHDYSQPDRTIPHRALSDR